MKLWVCQVRHQVFVGGESQRCRHSWMDRPRVACGEMELIGGEPVLLNEATTDELIRAIEAQGWTVPPLLNMRERYDPPL